MAAQMKFQQSMMRRVKTGDDEDDQRVDRRTVMF
jgi:hypothetical protein